ncbi:MAG: hypothetical protein WC759_05335, partial [Candidatus Micrarchaeia archaeon]
MQKNIWVFLALALFAGFASAAGESILVLAPSGSFDTLLPGYQLTYVSGASDYSTLQFGNYDMVVFAEYRTINSAEEQAIEAYVNSGKPVVLTGSVPSCFVRAAGCPYGAPTVNLTEGVDITPWFGAGVLTHASGTAYASEANAFGSGIASGARLAVGSGSGYSHILNLAPASHAVGTWDDSSVFAFYNGKVYYQSDVDNGNEPNSKKLFQWAVGWLLNTKKILVVDQQGTMDSLLAGYRVNYASGVADYSTLQFSSYDLVVFNEYHQLSASEEQAIQNYLSSKPIITTAGVPSCFAQNYGSGSCAYSLTAGVDISPWFGATQYANTAGSAYTVVNNAFGSGIGNNSAVMTGSGGGSAAISTSSLLHGSQVIAKWQDGKVFAFGTGRAYYQAGYNNANGPALFKAAAAWLMAGNQMWDEGVPAKKILVLAPQGSMGSLLEGYNVTYVSGASNYATLQFSN